MFNLHIPANILTYIRPLYQIPVGPITVRFRLKQNASWDSTLCVKGGHFRPTFPTVLPTVLIKMIAVACVRSLFETMHIALHLVAYNWEYIVFFKSVHASMSANKFDFGHVWTPTKFI